MFRTSLQRLVPYHFKQRWERKQKKINETENNAYDNKSHILHFLRIHSNVHLNHHSSHYPTAYMVNLEPVLRSRLSLLDPVSNNSRPSVLRGPVPAEADEVASTSFTVGSPGAEGGPSQGSQPPAADPRR